MRGYRARVPERSWSCWPSLARRPSFQSCVLTVQAEDSSGNLITSFNGTVTVALANNPGGATFGGTLSVQASGGVATFSGLTLNKAASGYTLYTSGGGFGWDVTCTVTVTPAAPTQLAITQQPPASAW